MSGAKNVGGAAPARRFSGSPVDLVTFDTMLGGPVTETAGQAYATAIELAVLVFQPDRNTPEIPEPAAAELAHDALARFAALSNAGLLKVIS